SVHSGGQIRVSVGSWRTPCDILSRSSSSRIRGASIPIFPWRGVFPSGGVVNPVRTPLPGTDHWQHTGRVASGRDLRTHFHIKWRFYVARSVVGLARQHRWCDRAARLRLLFPCSQAACALAERGGDLVGGL